MRTLSLLLAGALAACATPEPAWTSPAGREAVFADHRSEEWICIGVCSGTDWLTLGHVENVLLAEGIPSAAEGSRLYGISVPRSQTARAREALVARQRPDVYTCFAANSESAASATAPVILGWSRPEHGTVTTYGVPVAEVLDRPALDARIAAALREKHVVDLVPTMPVLDRVEVWERPYLGDDGAWKRGAHVEVRLVNAPGGVQGMFELQYAVWDGEPRAPLGGCAMFQSGNGAGPALDTKR